MEQINTSHVSACACAIFILEDCQRNPQNGDQTQALLDKAWLLSHREEQGVSRGVHDMG